jgi:hypothetical protein
LEVDDTGLAFIEGDLTLTLLVVLTGEDFVVDGFPETAEVLVGAAVFLSGEVGLEEDEESLNPSINARAKHRVNSPSSVNCPFAIL